MLIGLTPYPTLVCPALTVQLVDDKGVPVTDVISMNWDGLSTGGSATGYVQFDMAGRAALGMG